MSTGRGDGVSRGVPAVIPLPPPPAGAFHPRDFKALGKPKRERGRCPVGRGRERGTAAPPFPGGLAALINAYEPPRGARMKAAGTRQSYCGAAGGEAHGTRVFPDLLSYLRSHRWCPSLPGCPEGNPQTQPPRPGAEVLGASPGGSRPRIPLPKASIPKSGTPGSDGPIPKGHRVSNWSQCPGGTGSRESAGRARGRGRGATVPSPPKQ